MTEIPTTVAPPSWAEALRRCDAALAKAADVVSEPHPEHPRQLQPLLMAADEIIKLRDELDPCAVEYWHHVLLGHLNACAKGMRGLGHVCEVCLTITHFGLTTAFHPYLLDDLQDGALRQIEIARKAIAGWASAEKML